MSDHHPIRTVVNLIVQSNEQCRMNNALSKYPIVNWSDSRLCTAYSQHVTDAALSLPVVDFYDVDSRDEARTMIDYMCNDVATVMHNSCH